MEKPATFAKRLRQVLDETGWSQTELAKRANVSKSSITRYLKGDWEAKQDVIYSIANATGLNEAWLMGYDVPKNRPEKNTDTVVSNISQYQAILAWILDSEDVSDEMKLVIREELPEDSMDALSELSYQAGTQFDRDIKNLPTPVSESGPIPNIVKLAGRDGSYMEKRVSDEQLALFQAMLDQMKPVDDDSI